MLLKVKVTLNNIQFYLARKKKNRNIFKKNSSGNQTSCYSKESCCKIGTWIKNFEHKPNTTQVKVILIYIRQNLTEI